MCHNIKLNGYMPLIFPMADRQYPHTAPFLIDGKQSPFPKFRRIAGDCRNQICSGMLRRNVFSSQLDNAWR